MGRWYMVILLIWLCIPGVSVVQEKKYTGCCLHTLEKNLSNKTEDTTFIQTIIHEKQELTITVTSDTECLQFYVLLGITVFGFVWWLHKKITVLFFRFNYKVKSRMVRKWVLLWMECLGFEGLICLAIFSLHELIKVLYVILSLQHLICFILWLYLLYMSNTIIDFRNLMYQIIHWGRQFIEVALSYTKIRVE